MPPFTQPAPYVWGDETRNRPAPWRDLAERLFPGPDWIADRQGLAPMSVDEVAFAKTRVKAPWATQLGILGSSAMLVIGYTSFSRA